MGEASQARHEMDAPIVAVRFANCGLGYERNQSSPTQTDPPSLRHGATRPPTRLRFASARQDTMPSGSVLPVNQGRGFASLLKRQRQTIFRLLLQRFGAMIGKTANGPQPSPDTAWRVTVESWLRCQ